MNNLYQTIKKEFLRLIKDNGLEGEKVIVRAAKLLGLNRFCPFGG